MRPRMAVLIVWVAAADASVNVAFDGANSTCSNPTGRRIHGSESTKCDGWDFLITLDPARYVEITSCAVSGVLNVNLYGFGPVSFTDDERSFFSSSADSIEQGADAVALSNKYSLDAQSINAARILAKWPKNLQVAYSLDADAESSRQRIPTFADEGEVPGTPPSRRQRHLASHSPVYSSLCGGLGGWLKSIDNSTVARLGMDPPCQNGDGMYIWDGSSWSCVVPPFLPLPDWAYGNCFGRCNSGCGATSQFTVDCADYEFCIRFGIGNNTDACDDEFINAIDDWMISGNCDEDTGEEVGGTDRRYLTSDDDCLKQQETGNATECDVRITGPKCICMLRTRAFRAIGTPPGGNYKWKITKGNAMAQIIGPNNKEKVTVATTSRSAEANDVTLEVTYTPAVGNPCTKTHDFTVIKVMLSFKKSGNLSPNNDLIKNLEKVQDPNQRKALVDRAKQVGLPKLGPIDPDTTVPHEAYSDLNAESNLKAKGFFKSMEIKATITPCVEGCKYNFLRLRRGIVFMMGPSIVVQGRRTLPIVMADPLRNYADDDDPEHFDEDLTPAPPDCAIYVIDTPGLLSSFFPPQFQCNAAREGAIIVYNQNFLQWLNVEGERCTDSIDDIRWYVRTRIKCVKVGAAFKWATDGGVPHNDIGRVDGEGDDANKRHKRLPSLDEIKEEYSKDPSQAPVDTPTPSPPIELQVSVLPPEEAADFLVF